VLFLINHLIADGPSSALLVEDFGNIYGKAPGGDRDYSFLETVGKFYLNPQEESSRQHWFNILSESGKISFHSENSEKKSPHIPTSAENSAGLSKWFCSYEVLDMSPFLHRFQKFMKILETTSFPILVALWAAAFRNHVSNGKITFFSALRDSGNLFGPLFSLIALQCDVSKEISVIQQSQKVLEKLIEAQEHARGYPMEQVLVENDQVLFFLPSSLPLLPFVLSSCSCLPSTRFPSFLLSTTKSPSLSSLPSASSATSNTGSVTWARPKYTWHIS
jgi:hypothetical protein